MRNREAYRHASWAGMAAEVMMLIVPKFYVARLHAKCDIRIRMRVLRLILLLLVSLMIARTAAAQKNYDSGASDTEIKIGNIADYTGQDKEYGAVARAEAAYFQMVNDRGGVNGRKINFISLDDGSDAAKTADLTRQLVEQDGVLLIFSTFGTESNLAIRGYLNEERVPQLFVESSSAAFNNPARFPWTMGFFAPYRTEGLVYAKYILQNKPGAKIGVLYGNDNAGKGFLAGVRDGLGDKASQMIVQEESYSASDTALDSQIAALKASGADVFLDVSFGEFTTRAFRTAYDLDWHPLQCIPNGSLSVAAFLGPRRTRKGQGNHFQRAVERLARTGARKDPAVAEFLDWMSKYNPQASLRDQNNVAGYERAQALVEVLRKCGDDLTRANVMKQAANLDLELGMLSPGIKITTSPSDYQPIKQLYLIRFDGQAWNPIGSPIGVPIDPR